MGDFFTALPHYLSGILDLFFMLFYYLFRSISYIVSFVEALFRKLVGIDPMTINGFETGGDSSTDLVYGLIFNAQVQNLFWAILGFSVVLLVIFTIIALVKSEFTLDLKSSAKGPIIGRAFKAIINFFLVPIFTILAILGVNVLVRSISTLLNGDQEGIVAKCFMVGAYGANRVRLNDSEGKFADYLIAGHHLFGDGTDGDATPTNYFNEAAISAYKTSNSAETEGLEDDEVLALMIDDYFVGEGYTGDNPINSTRFKEFTNGSLADDQDSANKYAPWHTVWHNNIGGDTLPMYDAATFNFFYNPREFDFILAIGSAIVIAWSLLTVCLALLKRAFELVILFVLSPAMISLAPLDDGKALSSWRGEVFKRLLAVIGPLFAYNIFFKMVSILGNIELFTVGTENVVLAFAGERLIEVFNIFFQLIVLIVALGLLKTASQMISSLLGFEDLISTAGQLGSKAISTGTKAAMATVGAAAAVGGTVFKGTAAAVKGTARTIGHVRDNQAYKKLRDQSQEQYDYDQAKSDIDKYDNEMISLINQGKGEGDADYDAAAKNRADAQVRMQNAKKKLDSGEGLTNKRIADRRKEIDDLLSPGSDFNDNEEGLKLLEEYDNLEAEQDRYSEQLEIAGNKKNKSKSAFRRSIKEEFGRYKSNSFVLNAGAQIQNKIKENAKNHGFFSEHPHLKNLALKTADSKSLRTASYIMGAGLKDNYHRMYDGVLGLIGKDSGGGQALNMIFSGDARKSLYQSEFEKKRAEKAKEKKDNLERLENEERYREERENKREREKEKEQIRQQNVDMLNAAKIMAAEDEKGISASAYKSLLKDRDRAMRTGNEDKIRIANAQIERFEAKNGLEDKAKEVVAKLGDDDSLFERLKEIYRDNLAAANNQAFTEMGVKLKEGTKIDTNIDFDHLSETIKKTFEDMSKNISEMNTNFRDVASGLESIKKFLETGGNGNGGGTA